MSGMELTANYTPSKFAADNDLVKVDVVNKYRSAGDIVNVILPQVLSKVSEGVSVLDLCQYGDDLLFAQTHAVPVKEKGIAFPTCVSVNDLVQYISPMLDSDYNLKAGDVVKIELGAHLDGYVATAAHTTVVNTNASEPVQGRQADVVCATYYAHEAAMRMLKPGVKASEVTRVVNEIAAYYRCKPVEGTFSSNMKRFVLRAGRDIENRFADDLVVEELEKYDFQIEANQVYQLNVVLSTSEDGKVKTAEQKPTVYQRDVNQSYQLKLKSARAAFAEINKDHTVFPFAQRCLSTNQARLGLVSVAQHGLVNPLVPMRLMRKSDFVAQFKATVLVGADGNLRTTLPLPLPYVHSQYCIPEQTTAAQVLNTPFNLELNAAPAIQPAEATFGEKRLLNDDVEMA